MTPDVTVKQGDTDPPLDFILTSGGNALAFSGTETLKITARPADGGPNKIDGAPVFMDAEAGWIRYQQVAADVDTPGIYEFEIEVKSGDHRRTFPDRWDRKYGILAVIPDIARIP